VAVVPHQAGARATLVASPGLSLNRRIPDSIETAGPPPSARLRVADLPLRGRGILA